MSISIENSIEHRILPFLNFIQLGSKLYSCLTIPFHSANLTAASFLLCACADKVVSLIVYYKRHMKFIFAVLASSSNWIGLKRTNVERIKESRDMHNDISTLGLIFLHSNGYPHYISFASLCLSAERRNFGIVLP